MTRRGSPEERRWRRNRNLEPGADGSQHGEQPVDPKGRHPREKPSGHRHTDPQPAKEHGSGKHDGTVADNPHGDATHDSTVAPAPHGNASHSPGMVENAVGAPSLRRETRAAQPSPANVAVGTRSVIEDEANVEEVAADTTGDGSADSWLTVSTDPTHDHDTRYVNEAGDTMTGPLDVQSNVTVGDALFTSHGMLPTQFVTASDSREQNRRNSDFTANGTDDHVTIQNAVDALPVGTK